MKKLYLWILTCLLASSLIAQDFEEITDTPFEGVNKSSIAFADVDNDGDQDVLITGDNADGSPISKLYTNIGNGNFTEVFGTPFDGVRLSSIAFADIDNDNDQDVLITGENNLHQRIAKLYTNDGNGNFTEVLDTPCDTVPFYAVKVGSVAFADVDNDEDQDVLITGSWIAKLYTNDGNGNFTEVLETPFWGVTGSSIAFADIDNDNDQDVLITGYNYYFSSIFYINDGNGNFTESETPFPSGASGGSGSIAFADIDNDNDQDVLQTGWVHHTGICMAKLYRNLTIVGINENVLFSDVSIFPNPNTGLINIDLGSLSDVSIKVINVNGQLIYYKENVSTPIYQFELDAAPGIYILELSAGVEKQQFKLVEQ